VNTTSPMPGPAVAGHARPRESVGVKTKRSLGSSPPPKPADANRRPASGASPPSRGGAAVGTAPRVEEAAGPSARQVRDSFVGRLTDTSFLRDVVIQATRGVHIPQREVWGDASVSLEGPTDLQVATHARLAPPGADIDPVRDGFKVLSDSQTAGAYLGALGRTLIGEVFRDGIDFVAAKLGLSNLLGRTHRTAADLEAIKTLSRLVRGPDRFNAFFHPKSGGVILQEKSRSRSEKLEPAAPERSYEILAGLVHSPAHPELTSEVLRDAASILPPSAVELLANGGVGFELATADQPLAMVRRVFPDAEASFRADGGAEDSAGAYKLDARSIVLLVDRIKDPRARTQTAVHEFVHALDCALGDEEEPWSEKGEWKALFEEHKALLASGKEHGFTHSGQLLNAQEFLACTATTFLMDSVFETPASLMVETREDLARANPKAYALLERFFAEEVPRKLDQPDLKATLTQEHLGRIRTRLQPVISSDKGLLESVDPLDRMEKARVLTVGAVALRDPELLTVARSWADRAMSEASPPQRAEIEDLGKWIHSREQILRDHPTVT
jgi:hypothetical protein